MNEDYTSAVPVTAVGSPVNPRPTWGLKSLVIVTFIVALVPLTTVLFGGDTDDEEIERDVLIASSLISLFWYAGIASIVYFAARTTGGGWPHLGFRSPVFVPGNIFDSVRNKIGRNVRVWLPRMLVVPVAGYALSYVSVVVYSIISTIIGADLLLPDQQVPDEVFDSKVVVALIGASILIAAPLVEEIFFRGFLFGGLRKWLPFFPAALASGFLFSLAHQDTGLVIPFTMVGVVLAYSYEKTGTLFGSISVHFLFNLVSFVIMLALEA